MERRPSDYPNNESWSFPAGGEQKTPKEGKESGKSKKKSSESTLPAQSETAIPNVEKKESAPEATIWERLAPEQAPKEKPESKASVLEPLDEVVEAERVIREEEESAEKPKHPTVPKLEAQQSVTEENEKPAEKPKPQTVPGEAKKESAPEAITLDEMELPAPEKAESTAGRREPFEEGPQLARETRPVIPSEEVNPTEPFMPQLGQEVSVTPLTEEDRRQYFWTEPEVRQPRQTEIEHDILPAPYVGHETAPVGQKLAREYGLIPELPFISPPLERAVNPNEVAAQVAAHEANHHPVVAEAPRIPETRVQERSSDFGLGAIVATAAYFFGRRRGKRAVKSQSVKHANFENIPPVPSLSNETPIAPVSYPSHFSGEQAPVLARPESVPVAPPSLGAERTTNQAPVETIRRPERIGHVLVAAEGKVEANKDRTAGPRPPERVMKRAELLALAKSIRVDGVSVHEMFTAKRIDEDGLHRIVVEYLRGGDIKKVLSQEVIRQQIKFERDPQMRANPVETIEERRSKRASVRIKQQTKELLDIQRAKERTERLAEKTQDEVTKARRFLKENPKATTAGSVFLLIVIYAAIFIVMTSK